LHTANLINIANLMPLDLGSCRGI